MDMILKMLLALALLPLSNRLLAQQQTIYSNYFYNKVLINPAYTGLEDLVTASATLKRNWSGLNGAPASQILTFHAPLKKKNIAMGMITSNDQLGVTSETNIQLITSYRIYLANHILSFGLQPTFTFFNQKLSELIGVDPSDPSFNSGDISDNTFNLGVGFYLTHKSYYVGTSVARIIRGARNATESTTPIYDQLRQVSIHGGYLVQVNEKLKLQPNIFMRHIKGSPVQFDINLTSILSERVITGLSLHSLNILEGNLGILINPNFTLIYSLGFATRFQQDINRSSHEITLQYSFKPLLSRHISTRYF